jgi:hypothetical protein
MNLNYAWEKYCHRVLCCGLKPLISLDLNGWFSSLRLPEGQHIKTNHTEYIM